MSLTLAFAFCAVLFIFVFVWYGLSYLLTPHMDSSDGMAKVTGNCGDTIIKNFHWTDGCTLGRSCVETAAGLVFGATLSDTEKVTMLDTVEEIGHIPDSHLQCAQLAETTLQQAVSNYRDSEEKCNDIVKSTLDNTIPLEVTDEKLSDPYRSIHHFSLCLRPHHANSER